MTSLIQQVSRSPSEDIRFDFLILGGTGLIGSHFISEAQRSKYVNKITVLSRRETRLFDLYDKVEVIIEKDSLLWPELLSNSKRNFDVVFSSMGTTRGAAKTYAGQIAIDKDLTLSIAKVCKEELNVNMFVLVSSFNNFYLRKVFPYFKMKYNIEQELLEINFDHTLILQPGALVGNRSVLGQDQTFATVLSNILATLCYETSISWVVGYSIQAEQVAQTAIYLIETKSFYSNVKYAVSLYMLTLAKALEQI